MTFVAPVASCGNSRNAMNDDDAWRRNPCETAFRESVERSRAFVRITRARPLPCRRAVAAHRVTLGRVIARVAVLALSSIGCASEPTRSIEPTPPPASHLPDDHRVVARRPMRDADLVLTIDREHMGGLFVVDGERVHRVPCDRLPNAWGMWLDDVDEDGSAEAIVALHKPARFDPGDHHRLHVYTFAQGRCVPLWRGTRLAGRFDAATVEPDRHGTVLVHEWTAPRARRIARYRWTGFGYALDEILWQGGDEPPPSALLQQLDHPPDQVTP